jgi:hypothetical protein
MSTNNLAVQDSGPVNGFAVAAFVLSLMGMFASPIVSGILAIVGLRQVKRHGHEGFGLALAAMAISVAFTTLHIVMWIQCGHTDFHLKTASHW